MQYKNDNTTFHRSSAVSVTLALKFDVTGVLNCEKLLDNFACLKAWKKTSYLVSADADNYISASSSWI